MLLKTFRLSHLLAVIGLSMALAACGGSRPDASVSDGGDGGGGACQFDTDCNPPDTICGSTGTCEPGCLRGGCIVGKTCNPLTGRCGTAGGTGDGGNNDGGNGDGGADGGGGTASDTLCQPCTVNGDCHAAGICVSNTAHTAKYCTQDCTTDACPTGYQCTTDSTGSRHQCFPSTDCATVTGNDAGTTTTPDAGGSTNDPTIPSDNPNGCKMCGECAVNNDCVSGNFCLNGICATPCTSSGITGTLECVLAGGSILSQCADVGLPNGQRLCVPLLGACFALPSPLTPLSGDISCVPSGTNPTCSAPSIPSPALGANVAVSSGLNPKPALGTDPAIARDSSGHLAIAFINVDGSSNSTITACSSSDDGATFGSCSTMKSTLSGSVQSDPTLAVSKWTDGTGSHERIHLGWLSYVLTVSGGTATPNNMTVEDAFSDDGGKTWSNGAKVTTSADNNNGSLQIDKPWMAAAADGTLVMTFSVGNTSSQHVYASTSTDHSASWNAKKPVYSNTVLNDNNFGHTEGMAVFDPSDATSATIWAVYLKYTTTSAANTNTVELVKSTDKGQTWLEQGTVSGTGEQVFFDAPSIAIDAAHRLYVGYSSAPSGGNNAYWDAMVATVDISGASPVTVRNSRASDDSAACFQHFHVTVAVDSTTSALYVAWLDNRDQGKGDVWLAKSTDQGASFGTSLLVSTTNFDFNPDRGNAQAKSLGDYLGITTGGGKVRLTWSDPRDGSESQIFYSAGAP